MVGIVLASHGGFAAGIYQSGEMIFGPQENVAQVILQPDEGPDELHRKLLEAVETFDDPEQVLFLVDLWGGTPFNQASKLCEGHPDTWAIVTGMNLPMVIEAYAARLTMQTAREIAAKIVTPAQAGIKTQPAALMPSAPAAAQAPAKQPQGPLPAGTVIGDGQIKYVLARIDSRLLHGQVATGWTKATKPDRIIVVSDQVAHDKLRKQMITQAAPTGVHANTVPIQKMIEVAKDPRFGGQRIMLLFENPEDALKTIAGGVPLKELNLGSMAYRDGKVNVNQVLAMDQADIDTFKKLQQLGVKFDVRKVPSSAAEDLPTLLQKAQKLVDQQRGHQ